MDSLQMNVPASGGGGYNLIEDEGIPQTARTTINFIGGGVTVSDVAGETQVSIPGGGGSSPSTAVINLPYPAKRTHRVSVTDGAVTGASKITLSVPGSDILTNNDDTLDMLSMMAIPGAGSFLFIANFLVPHAGPLTINYSVG